MLWSFRILAVAGVLLAAMPWMARADWAMSVDVPVSSTLMAVDAEDSGENIASGAGKGAMVAVFFPGILGMGLDYYEIPLDTEKAGLQENYRVAMVNLLFTVPIPYVELVLGLGAGSGSFDPGDVDLGIVRLRYKDATLTQALITLGIEPIEDLAFHAAYRAFRGTHRTEYEFGGETTAGDDFDIAGSTVSVGFTFYF